MTCVRLVYEELLILKRDFNWNFICIEIWYSKVFEKLQTDKSSSIDELFLANMTILLTG